MKNQIRLVGLLIPILSAFGALAAAQGDMPDWAYAVPTGPNEPTPLDSVTMYNLEGSSRSFTRNQIRGRDDHDENIRTTPADWFPDMHPPMPDVVANGDNDRGVIACALCHYPNGKGRSENASPAGLPRDYIVQQLHDFQNDVRVTAEPRKNNYFTMINIAKGMTEEEIVQASDYFASMEWSPWIRVVETDTVPKTYSQGGMMLVIEGDGAGTEPIGNRIIETPENTELTELYRDPRSGFIAYVPEGAVSRGENIVRTGDSGRTIQCTICHGENLHGLGNVPGIAARSPSYIVRQLYDIQQGTRHGAGAALMGPVVANLTSEDMVNIAAYTASLPAN